MLELYEPHIEDLWFKEKMMDDEQTMAYNHAYGGTIPFPKEKWTNWHQRWITDHSGKRFYRYIQDNDAFVGEVAYYFDEERQIYIADVVIYAPYRGKGYGRKALQLLCEIAKENGIRNSMMISPLTILLLNYSSNVDLRKCCEVTSIF